MNLSKQKIDIDGVLRELMSHVSMLQQNIAILKRGMDAIDEGEDILNGNSMLASEVRKIMRNPIEKP